MEVVDSSVIVKWLIDEEGTKAALAYLGTDLIAPELVVAEVANVAWKKWRRKEISREQALAVSGLAASFVKTTPVVMLTEAAMSIALEIDHPAYDCYFLALAEDADVPFITFDRRLWLRCKASRFVKFVNYLGPREE